MKMLRIARKSKGMTMKELGDRVGVSESAISQYENGKREADFETTLKIGEVLGCSIDYLLRGTQDPGPISEDVLDEVDVAFYGEYKELTEDDKETVRDMVRIMRERRAKKQE